MAWSLFKGFELVFVEEIVGQEYGWRICWQVWGYVVEGVWVYFRGVGGGDYFALLGKEHAMDLTLELGIQSLSQSIFVLPSFLTTLRL